MRLTQGLILVVKGPGSELISVSPELWAEPGLQGWVNYPTQRGSRTVQLAQACEPFFFPPTGPSQTPISLWPLPDVCVGSCSSEALAVPAA